MALTRLSSRAFFFNDPATTEIYTLSLHDALPIFGGDRIGELADAGYIEPLDKYVSQWEDWKNYPDSIKGGVSYQGKVWAIPYGLYAGAAGDTGVANHAFVPLVWAYGGDVIDKNGKWIGDSPAIRKALDYYARAYSGGLVPKEVLTSTKPWTA